MFCKNCGHQIDDGSTNYCPNCGSSVKDESLTSEPAIDASKASAPINEVPVGKIMGKFICLVLGIVGIIGSGYMLVNSHADWESHVWALNGMRNSKWNYSGEYFWSFGNETWFSYAPMGFILLAVSIAVFIIGCCIKGTLKGK